MNALTPHTVLYRVPDLRVNVDSSSNTEILANGKSIMCGSYALSVLDVFSKPTSLSKALQIFESRIKGAQDSMDLTSTILQLYRAGILLDQRDRGPTLKKTGKGYESAGIHISMLSDTARTSAYLTGIREVVKVDDVVIDLGTGTGVFALAAAQAGARHVYAIEASSIGTVAKSLFEINGFADRITLVPGWSTQIDLPESADVLISEVIGHEPLGERVLEVTLDALKRLVKPNGLLVPSKVRIWGLPVIIPSSELMKHLFSAAPLDKWSSRYDIDFTPLGKLEQNSPYKFFVKTSSARNWSRLGAPILLADLDLRSVSDTALDLTSTGSATASGELNGLLLYHELQLSPNTSQSTHPGEASDDSSWRSTVWYLGSSLPLQMGDRFAVNYRYRFDGMQNLLSVRLL